MQARNVERTLMVGLVALASVLRAAPGKPDGARETMKEWARTERAISRETAEWERERALLEDLVDVARQRVDRLEETLAKHRSALSQAERERAELRERDKRARKRIERVRAFVREREAALREVRPMLPRPLEQEVADAYRSFPDEGEAGRVGVAKRMRGALTAMNAIREFDGKTTVAESVRETEEGGKGVYRTLYYGLGQAYYIGPDGAGFGYPEAEGWTWVARPEAATAIEATLEIAEDRSGDLRLIDLPARLGAGAGGGASADEAVAGSAKSER